MNNYIAEASRFMYDEQLNEANFIKVASWKNTEPSKKVTVIVTPKIKHEFGYDNSKAVKNDNEIAFHAGAKNWNEVESVKVNGVKSFKFRIDSDKVEKFKENIKPYIKAFKIEK